MLKKILAIFGGGCLTSFIMFFLIIVIIISPLLLLANILSNNDLSKEELIEYAMTVESSNVYLDIAEYIVPFNNEKEPQIPNSYYVYGATILGLDYSKKDDLEYIYKNAVKEKEKDDKGNVIYEVMSVEEYAKHLLELEDLDFNIDNLVYLLNFSKSDDFTGNWISGNGEFQYPLKDRAVVTTEFRGYEGHNGIDLAYNGGAETTCGVPIYSSTSGVVSFSGDNGLSGNSIDVKYGIYTIRYLHMESPSNLKEGMKIERGDYIGNIGNTGQSDGCHLHHEIRENGVPVNPRKHIDY